MKRNCPTIHELLALDALARRGSLGQAAQALCLTPSAVSKQLSALESFLGFALLARQGRSLTLTPAGRHYWLQVADSLHTIEAATHRARLGVHDSRGGELTLASVPTFLSKWLIPRLASLRASCPHLKVNFSQHLRPGEALSAHVHAALRYGQGHWPGMRAQYLTGRRFIAVAAPALLPGGQPLTHAGLRQQTLLHHQEAPSAWMQWAHLHRCEGLRRLDGPRFAQYSTVIEAAINGLGVALVPAVLVEQEVARGELARACGQAVMLDQGHYLCTREDQPETPQLAAFRAWIVQQASTSEQHTA